MAMLRRLGAAAVIACAALATLPTPASADEIPIITGKQWTQSTEPLKKAYLVGIANILQVEAAYHAEHAPPDSESLLPRISKGMTGETLDSVRDQLDSWYAANPDRLNRPVIETIWFEMVLPKLQAKK